MAKISLREYNREIESLIDHESNNEAIFHSKEILKSFPKCLETYRNLGKALLESKKYPEAKEIFSRVLAVIPDDFISHVGLSIISEDERDLNTSIWHMEQAYDSQPSNLAIQEELRRLFGRRDGIQPTKIRLTHGALVRMYAKGELFQQAISEIRTALTEDPKRVDLKVILAQMFFQSGQTVEAIETCSEIVQTHPYCFEANKILFSGLATSGKKDATRIYLDKLKELDPYVTEDSLDSSLISPEQENQILIDKPAYSPSPSDSEISWSEQFSIEPIESKTKTSTDWLTQIEADLSKEQSSDLSESLSPFIEEPFEKQLPSEEPSGDKKVESRVNDDIPEWMRHAGWSESTQPESPAFSETLNDIPSGETAESAELPDWLRALSPDAESNTPTTASEEEKPDEGVFPTFDLSLENALPNKNEDQPTEDSLINMISEPIEPANKIPEDIEEKSEWLKEFETQPQEPSEPEISQDLPDWLISYDAQEANQTKPNVEADSKSPDWLDSLIDENENLPAVSDIPQPSESLPDTPVSEDILDELDRLEQSLISETSEPPTVSSEDTGQLSSSEALSLETEVVPSWVKDILTTTPETSSIDVEIKPSETQSIPEDVISHETKPVMESFEPQKANDQEIIAPLVTDIPGHSVPDGLISSQTNEELMDWLRGLDPDAANAEIQEPTQITSIPEAEIDQSSLGAVLERLDNIGQSAMNAELEETGQIDGTAPRNEVAKEPVNLPTIPESLQEQLNDLPVFPAESFSDHIESTNVQQVPEVEPQVVSEIESASKVETAPDVQVSSSPEELIQILLLEKEVRGNSFEFWLNLGDLYMQVENFVDALKAYNHAENILLK